MAVGRRGARHAKKGPVPFGALVAALVTATAAVAAWQLLGGRSEHEGAPVPGPSVSVPTPSPSPTGVYTPPPINTKFEGLTTFRGNATRSYYGEGPLPRHPKVLWTYPTSGGLCSKSSDAKGVRTWCGTGWTGQPNVIVRDDGKIEIREGAYDGNYHFLNGKNGKPLRPAFHTGDLAKGSATSDADGYPLYYAGSRDNFLRVIALDRPEPTELWRFNAEAVPERRWNNDWDAAPLQIGDYLLEGGENAWFHVFKLNRHYDADHKVQVDPQVVMLVPGWDDQLSSDVPDDDVSIENSVAFSKGVAYFSNSGGLVQGWKIRDVLHGGKKHKRVFRFWAGDDVDASIVIDQEGYLYVSRHVEENVPRSGSLPRDREIGGLMKLDPRKEKNPVVWDVPIGSLSPDGGSLSTPALYDGVVYDEATNGEVIAVDQEKGKVLWRMHLPPPLNGSPVTIDHQLLVGDCDGVLHNFDISRPKHRPKELWAVKLAGCIESTPAVWKGRIWVGTRGGQIYGIGDRKR